MKRYTERSRENEYVTSNAIIKELNIDYTIQDKDYIVERQAKIIIALDNKLGEIEDLMEKYEINSVEALEEIVKDYDDMAKSIVEMGLGVKVEIKEDKSE